MGGEGDVDSLPVLVQQDALRQRQDDLLLELHVLVERRAEAGAFFDEARDAALVVAPTVAARRADARDLERTGLVLAIEPVERFGAFAGAARGSARNRRSLSLG